jgi:hypothetical protein
MAVYNRYKQTHEHKGKYHDIEQDVATCKMPMDITVVLPDKCPGCGKIVDELARDMAKWFEGVTMTNAKGCWVDTYGDGHMECEPVRKLESGHKCMDKEKEEMFIKRVTRDANRMNQTALMLRTGKTLIIQMKEYDQ